MKTDLVVLVMTDCCPPPLSLYDEARWFGCAGSGVEGREDGDLEEANPRPFLPWADWEPC